MSNVNPELSIDSSLVNDGLEWAQEQYIQANKPGIENALKALYFNGLELYAYHRENIVQRVEEAGGVRRIHQANFSSPLHNAFFDHANMNAAECMNGELIGLNEMLCMEPIDFPVSENAAYSRLFNVRRDGHLRLSFGGDLGGGIDASEADAYLNNSLVTHDAIEKILEGEYLPHGVAITESLVTRYDEAQAVAVSGLSYRVQAMLWNSKLREEFAPKRYQDPAAYWAWVATKPLPHIDVSFAASPTPSREPIQSGTFMASHAVELETYFDAGSYSRIKLGAEGVEKALRFAGLLGTIWHHEFGDTMPMPTVQPDQKALETAESYALTE